MADKMQQAWKVDPKKPGSPLPLLEVWGRNRDLGRLTFIDISCYMTYLAYTMEQHR